MFYQVWAGPTLLWCTQHGGHNDHKVEDEINKSFVWNKKVGKKKYIVFLIPQILG